MNKRVNAHEIPLCTNIIRLQSYLLSPDEVVSFDWFVVKQIAFKYKDFHYSQPRIEKETRIKRTRQDVIIKHFCELGFLTTEVRKGSAYLGGVRYFRLCFEALAKPEVLKVVIDQDHPSFQTFVRFMKQHAAIEKANAVAKQKTDDAVEPNKEPTGEKDSAKSKRDADRVYNILNDIYDTRRRMYNDGDLTEEIPEGSKDPMPLQRNKRINERLAMLTKHYEDGAIKNIFIAYADSVLTGREKPENLMNYFLTYSQKYESFTTVDAYMNVYTLRYTNNSDY